MNKSQKSLGESLKRAHVSLLADLQKLEEAVSSLAETKMAALRSRLVKARTHLTQHFRYEEKDGYMDAIRGGMPHLEREIQRLQDEHGQLSQSLDELIEKSWAADNIDEAFRAKVRAWLGQVHQHEVRENSLVEDAFNTDLAAED
jgi:hypothetical protein